MPLNFHALFPAHDDAAPGGSWLEGFLSMTAVGLGVLIVAGIAVLLGMV